MRKHTAGKLDKAIGLNIKQHRKMRGRTQSDLAAHVGVSYQQVNKYESGKNCTPIAAIYSIAEYLNISILSILPGQTIDTAQQQEFVHHWNRLRQPQRDDVLAIMKDMKVRK